MTNIEIIIPTEKENAVLNSLDNTYEDISEMSQRPMHKKSK